MSDHVPEVDAKAVSVPSAAQDSILRFTYVWQIDNFSSRRNDRVIISNPFASKAENRTLWCLKVYPKGDSKRNKGHISIHLNLVSCKSDGIQAKFRICILDADKKPIQAMELKNSQHIKCGEHMGFGKFIGRACVLGNPQQYFPKNKLTIHCLVSTLIEAAAVPKLNNLNPDPEAAQEPSKISSPPEPSQQLSEVGPQRATATTQTEQDMFDPLSTSTELPRQQNDEESNDTQEITTDCESCVEDTYDILARELADFSRAATRLLDVMKQSNIDHEAVVKMIVNNLEVQWPLPDNPEELFRIGQSTSLASRSPQSFASYGHDFLDALADLETRTRFPSDASEADLLETTRIVNEIIMIELSPAQFSRLEDLRTELELYFFKVPSIVDRWELHRAYPVKPSIAKAKSTPIENSVPGKTRSLLGSLNACAGAATGVNCDNEFLPKRIAVARTPNFNRSAFGYCAARVEHLAALKPGCFRRKMLTPSG